MNYDMPKELLGLDHRRQIRTDYMSKESEGIKALHSTANRKEKI